MSAENGLLVNGGTKRAYLQRSSSSGWPISGCIWRPRGPDRPGCGRCSSCRVQRSSRLHHPYIDADRSRVTVCHARQEAKVVSAGMKQTVQPTPSQACCCVAGGQVDVAIPAVAKPATLGWNASSLVRYCTGILQQLVSTALRGIYSFIIRNHFSLQDLSYTMSVATTRSTAQLLTAS